MAPLQLLEEFSQNLECPVCMEFFSPPIFTCIIGHLICSRCRGMLSSCPLCRETFIGTRSFIAEQSLATLSKLVRIYSKPPSSSKMIYQNSLVTEMDSQQNLQNSTLVRCCLAVNGCRHKLIEASDYVNHLKVQHLAFVAEIYNGYFVQKISIPHTANSYIKRGTERLFILETLGRSFIVNMAQQGVEIRIWVQTDICIRRSADLKAEICIMGIEGERKISWLGSLNGLQSTDESVRISGNCLKTSCAQLKECIKEDALGKFWIVNVKIFSSSISPMAHKFLFTTGDKLGEKILNVFILAGIFLAFSFIFYG